MDWNTLIDGSVPIALFTMDTNRGRAAGGEWPAGAARRWCWPARPTCGVRLLPGTNIPADPDPGSHCAREGDTWRLLVNARWLPFVIAHGLLDELVPFASVAEQVLELDRLGYRYRFTVYPAEDHVVFLFQDKFDDPVSHMGTGPRQPDPWPHHLRLVPAAGPPRPGHRATPPLVAVRTGGSSGHQGKARRGRRGRRAIVCPP